MITQPVVFNPFDPVWKADPYPFYQRLRSEAPIGQVPYVGIWYLTRFADCESILHNPKVGSDTRKSTFYQRLAESRTVRMPDEVADRRSFLFLDPPDHTRLRSLVMSAFTPKVINAMRTTIQTLIDELLALATDRQQFDLVDEFAYPLAFSVISNLLGIPSHDQDRFRVWSKDMAGSNDPMMDPPPDVVERQQCALREGSDYIRAIISSRREAPRDDLISALVAAQVAGHQLTDDEIVSTVTLLVAAGHESTVSMIGNAVHALIQHPQQLAYLRRDVRLARAAIEETLRWDPPVQMTQRIGLEDLEIEGHHIDQGTPILVVLAAANRDDNANPDGERFDITRDNIRHLAFGMGTHFCLGAALARAEGVAVLNALVARFPQWELAGMAVRREDLVMRGFQALPLEV